LSSSIYQHLQEALDSGYAEHGAFLNELGFAYGQTERKEEAAHMFQRAFDKEPETYRAIVNLAQLQRTQGHREKAIATFGKVVSLRDPCQPHKSFGKKNSSLAKPKYCAKLAFDSEDFEDALYTAHLQMAVLQKRTDPNIAEIYFKQAMKVRETEEVLIQLGEFYEEQGGERLALSYYKRCTKQSSGSFVQASCYARTGRLLEAASRLKEAQEEYQLAIALAPDHKYAIEQLKKLGEKSSSSSSSGGGNENGEMNEAGEANASEPPAA
jgi:tetratricopeptide (TPR) repeat protein